MRRVKRRNSKKEKKVVSEGRNDPVTLPIKGKEER